ncbi:LytR/AlgR family response regulator transcription factor [Chitinophaga lutea]
MNIRCLIIDDEPLARKGLREYLEDVPFLELAGECADAAKAIPLIAASAADLLFLDIRMPRMTGLALLRSLPQPPPVIFTTAYPDYAVESFELNVLDYLLKPISFERFMKAALKAQAYFDLRRQPDAPYFFIKCDNRLEKIAYADILFVEALQNYVAIHTLSRKLITYLTFKAVEDYLPASHFVRVHKSYIASLDKIDAIEGNELLLGPHRIPMSRGLKDEALEKILRDRFLKR